jgi:hypothetical protein
MKCKSLFLGLFLFAQAPLITFGQQRDIFMNSDFAKFLDDVKSIVYDYSKQNKAEDYQIIVKIKEDTIDLYLRAFTSLAGSGHLEPFIYYKMVDINLYLFMADGVKWKRDSTFNIQKSEAVFGENPIWLITLCNNGMTLRKGVRGYFAPPLPPKNYKGKYKPPKIR